MVTCSSECTVGEDAALPDELLQTENYFNLGEEGKRGGSLWCYTTSKTLNLICVFGNLNFKIQDMPSMTKHPSNALQDLQSKDRPRHTIKERLSTSQHHPRYSMQVTPSVKAYKTHHHRHAVQDTVSKTWCPRHGIQDTASKTRCPRHAVQDTLSKTRHSNHAIQEMPFKTRHSTHTIQDTPSKTNNPRHTTSQHIIQEKFQAFLEPPAPPPLCHQSGGVPM